jgi:uncharacterized protein (TIGR03086 family)
VIDLKPAGDRLIDLTTGITDDRLARATPCTDYTVGDLIDHLDNAAQLFTSVALGDNGLRTARTGPSAAHLGPGWRDSFTDHVRALGKAWDAPRAWQGSAAAVGLELPNELWGKIALTELVVHGWDIARALDVRFELPEQTLRACHDHLTAFVVGAPVPGLFGAPVDVSPDAPLFDRIVAITGRVP